MSHHLRKEKNCLNCEAHVELRFCGNCGQENIEPRQTFGHLIAHFFEDLTHYEGKFWPTLRYLFFKPAFLTREFLSGKRSRYLPPVRLYIFASFITFLVPGLIPDPPEKSNAEGHTQEVRSTGIASVDSVIAHGPVRDAVPALTIHENNREHDTANHVAISLGYSNDDGIRLPTPFHSLWELDSAKQARTDTDDPLGFVEYRYHKKAIELGHNKYPPHEQLSLFMESLKHNIPKALFLYMPLFALILRLFHKRKNWIYFDHGIFTLHYFSFMLLVFLAMILLLQLGSWILYMNPLLNILGTALTVIMVAALFWIPYYLYRAHRKMYGETKFISFIKTTMILLLNGVLFIGVLCTLVLITLLTMH